MSFTFKYSPSFKRQIKRVDGSWFNITFNYNTERNSFLREHEEHIHRAFTNLYYMNTNFRMLVDGTGEVPNRVSIAVINNFHQTGEETHPHINFQFKYQYYQTQEIMYHAYFDPNGEIYRVTHVVEVL